MLIVQKYGGSSLADAQRIRRAAERIARQVKEGHHVVVVVSAQGDTTDLLLEQLPQLTTQPPPRELDAYLASGEQMSAALMAMALEEMDVSAVSLTGWQAGLMTDSVHGDARVKGLRGERIRRELQGGNAVVVAGFQGVDAAAESGCDEQYYQHGGKNAADGYSGFFEKCFHICLPSKLRIEN